MHEQTTMVQLLRACGLTDEGMAEVERDIRAWGRGSVLVTAREVFVPQSYAWGAEAQVDFHEPARTVKLFFVLRSSSILCLLFSFRFPVPDDSRPDFDSHSLRSSQTGCMRGSDYLRRCCQLVGGLDGQIDFRSHRDPI